jgi:hypothetical protein
MLHRAVNRDHVRYDLPDGQGSPMITCRRRGLHGRYKTIYIVLSPNDTFDTL